MHLRRRAKNHRIHISARQALIKLCRDVADRELLGHLVSFIQLATDQRYDLHAVDFLYAFQMLDAESASTGERDLEGAHCEFSKIK